MSRKIKFRAMIVGSNGPWIATQGNHPEIATAGLFLLKYGDHELMQYTGLKDKNGVEIYEGDILHIESGNTYGDTDVRFEEGSFCLKTVTDYTFWFHYFEEDAMIEVIGNIYENPELHKT